MDMTVVSLGMGVDWIWGVPGWETLQHSFVLVRTRLRVGQAGLSLPLLKHMGAVSGWVWIRLGSAVTPNSKNWGA